MSKPQHARTEWRSFAQNAAIRFVLGALRLVPYRARVPMMGWIVSRVVAPLAGWDKRVKANLAHTCPELSDAEVRRLMRAVPNNAGRTLIEIYSGQQFINRVKNTELSGPGKDAFLAARTAGKPVILVTAQFGNYDAPRAALFAQGHPLGALYRRMRNQRFNEHYVEAISLIGKPVFPADRRGITDLIRYLKDGNTLGILIDVYAIGGAPLTFFGQPAPTALSTAEWALKYNAVVLPIYGIRQDNGLDFKVVIDEEIPASTPEIMTQALNDSLERQVRMNMDQWFWIHRRWKPEDQDQGSLAAATTGP